MASLHLESGKVGKQVVYPPVKARLLQALARATFELGSFRGMTPPCEIGP